MTIKRGRKSSADLTTTVENAVGLVKREERLMAPAVLTEPERVVWLQLVNDQPAGVFAPIHIPIMTMYCRHVAKGNFLADVIEQLQAKGVTCMGDIENLDMLLKMIDRETKAATSMARALRITRLAADESRVVGRANAKHRAASRVVKPWDDA